LGIFVERNKPKISFNKYRVFYLLLIVFVHNSTKAEIDFKLQSGLGYIEHFSTGIGIAINNKHSLSVLYGSDFFINARSFSSYLLQYEYFFYNLKYACFVPKIGLKGGYSVYTNNFYKWELIKAVPTIGVVYTINNCFDLYADIGIALSRELTMKRIRFGEIGWYRKQLPEFKIGIIFNL
jgi:hypothetical protein